MYCYNGGYQLNIYRPYAMPKKPCLLFSALNAKKLLLKNTLHVPRNKSVQNFWFVLYMIKSKLTLAP